jgi:hypothetical protein
MNLQLGAEFSLGVSYFVAVDRFMSYNRDGALCLVVRQNIAASPNPN